MIRLPPPGHNVKEVTEIVVESLLDDALDLEDFPDEVLVRGLNGPEDGRAHGSVLVQARLVRSALKKLVAQKINYTNIILYWKTHVHSR